MKVFDITYYGERVTLADLPEYRKFYRKLECGTWEPRTFRVLSDQLGPDVTYIDIGGWIGVTPFWAAKRAKRVIVVEPDPKCRGILRELLPHYPNVTLTECALSSQTCLKLNAVEGFGSSETSALAIGDGCSIEVRGCSMAELLSEVGADPVFVKIDIEGYEYVIADELKRLDSDTVRGVQLAVHPALYERSLGGFSPFRRGKTLRATLRLARLYHQLKRQFRVGIFPGLTAYLVWGVLFKHYPKGADVLFLNQQARLQSGRENHTLAARTGSTDPKGQKAL